MTDGNKLFPVSFLCSLMICVSLALFVAGALRQGEAVNTDMTSADQSAYMHDAQKMRTSHFQHLGDRARVPVYPGLMALFYRERMTDDAFFTLGKRVGIGLAIAVLTTSFFLLRRYVHFIEAFTAIQVGAFTVFVYKSPYFQPETLYYGLAFALFVLMVELVSRPRLMIAIAAGLIGGIAHLTKASVLPGIVLCLLCLLLRAVLQSSEPSPLETRLVIGRSKLWLHVQPLICACVFAGMFLLVVFPYIRTSKERFGYYFYNVSSTFYMWYDSWDEAVAGTRAHGDRVGWPDMPADQIPSLRKYLHEHSTAQIVARFASGLNTMRRVNIKSSGYAPFGYTSFLMLYTCFVVLLLCQNREHFTALFRIKTNTILLFFVLSYFATYLALYAWYTPIASGNRFFLALFLPAMFSVVWVISHAIRCDLSFSVCGRRIQASVASPLVLLALLAYLILIYPDQISTLRGGL